MLLSSTSHCFPLPTSICHLPLLHMNLLGYPYSCVLVLKILMAWYLKHTSLNSFFFIFFTFLEPQLESNLLLLAQGNLGYIGVLIRDSSDLLGLAHNWNFRRVPNRNILIVWYLIHHSHLAFIIIGDVNIGFQLLPKVVVESSNYEPPNFHIFILFNFTLQASQTH